MSKPKSAPAGTKARNTRYATVVENQDFTELMSAAPSTNRKQRRAAAKHSTPAVRKAGQ